MDPATITLEQLTHSHHDVLAALRAEGPVCPVPVLEAWVVTSREVAIEVLRDPERFTVDDPRFSTAQVVGPSMLSLEGPEHRRHRSPFVAALRPSDVSARFGPAIDAEARALVERMAPAGRGDLNAGLAGPLAAFSSAIALGLVPVDTAALLSWYRAIVAATERIALGGAVDGSTDAPMAALRAAVRAAADDSTTSLSAVVGHLTDDEIASNAAVFLFGGIETTEGMIVNLLVHLLSHPDVLDAVRADRSLADAAIEESLRLDPAVARVDRYATVDVELGGRSIAAGDFVVVSLSAANRDPAVYERPDEFDIARAAPVGHLAFVQGPHACVGAQLARLEARAALSAVLDLLPEVTFDVGDDPDAHDDTRIAGIVFRKARSLPVRWRAATPTPRRRPADR